MAYLLLWIIGAATIPRSGRSRRFLSTGLGLALSLDYCRRAADAYARDIPGPGSDYRSLTALTT